MMRARRARTRKTFARMEILLIVDDREFCIIPAPGRSNGLRIPRSSSSLGLDLGRPPGIIESDSPPGG
jgi:hypothetical protein